MWTIAYAKCGRVIIASAAAASRDCKVASLTGLKQSETDYKRPLMEFDC